MDEKWQKLGSTLTDAIIFAQIWAIICFVLFAVIVILVSHYLKKSKQEKETGNSDYKNSKKNILLRISIEIDSKHLPSDETMIDVCKRTKEFFKNA